MKFEDDFIVAKIVNGLPVRKYSDFITVWNSKEPTKQTLENLTIELSGHEEILNKADEEVEALAAKSRKDTTGKGTDKKKFNKKSKKERKDFTGKCYNCGEEGHMIHVQNRKRLRKVKLRVKRIQIQNEVSRITVLLLKYLWLTQLKVCGLETVEPTVT